MESNKKIVPRLLAGASVLSLLGAVLFSGKTYGKEQNASTDAVEALLSEMTLEEKVFLVGINYDVEGNEKKHTCVIEEWR